MSSTTPCQSSSCPNGNPPSRLECPTCNKSVIRRLCFRCFLPIIRIGIRGSFFCGQECFKAGCRFYFSLLSPTSSNRALMKGCVHILNGHIAQRWTSPLENSQNNPQSGKASSYQHGCAHPTSSSFRPNFHILDGTYNPFPNYSFTGSVYPAYPLSPTRQVPEHIPRPDYAADGSLPDD